MFLELTPEQEAFKRTAEAFARDVVAPRAAAIDQSGDYPLDVIRAAGTRGAGRDYVSYALAIEAIARASATVAAALSVNNSLVAELIAYAGHEQQKEEWLRRLTSGDAIGAFALSEQNAGSDAANQQTTAVKAGGRYRIGGRKAWMPERGEASGALVF